MKMSSRYLRSIMKILFVVVFMTSSRSLVCQTWTADNGDGTYSNPLFFDEFSDPDMIRVGSDFYLTGTTMHSMPGLPILHSKDLVNWDFVAYAMDKLDLGPAFRLEGANVYGQGIWAPSFRYHAGTFYIFSNVNGHTSQMFRANSPAGPWTRTPMKRSFHDLSILFDDDGKTYVVWGYREIHLAELNEDFTDIVPGSEKVIITSTQGMGEGLHLYKIKGKYILTSAWYLGEMRMPTARADQLTGPWEVNQNVSRGEDFGLTSGNHLSPTPKRNDPHPSFFISPPDLKAVGRLAIHQGGIVDTPTGDWWGFSMMDANSIGRLVTLSPVTWTEGWPYFGLSSNLGRSPRTWVKPLAAVSIAPHAPYVRSDNFSKSILQPIWQWNHVPVDDKWSLTERAGFLRLHVLPATNLLTAKNTLTQRAIGPRSIPTTILDAAGLKEGDVAGFALFNRPYAWIGVAKEDDGLNLELFAEQSGLIIREPLKGTRVWLRADCDFLREIAQFSYSSDGKTFHDIGIPFPTVFQLLTFQGVRYSLFSFNKSDSTDSGFADFDSFAVNEPTPHANTRPIPYGSQIALTTYDLDSPMQFSAITGSPAFGLASPTPLMVSRQGPGRVMFSSGGRYLHVEPDGHVALSARKIGDGDSFQWIETFSGELTLMSLVNHRYLRVDAATGMISADSPGPRAGGKDGVRFDWQVRDR
jgi:xylan 1,4-beta-xylosidase